ncbi:spherulation-specific family 4 protein [Isosphaeraceae bacterium EP7]
MRRPHLASLLARRLTLVLAIVSASPMFVAPAQAGEITALVPAYFYPTWWVGSAWDDLNVAAARIPIEAIMNPASGPGSGSNSDYQYAVGSLQAAGGKVIGYVATGYGSRTAEEVLADVVSYLDWYDVDGIFVDEMGNQLGGLDYAALYFSIKALGVDLHVVGNPGTPFAPANTLVTAVDTLVIYEGPLQNADPNGASFRMYPNRGPYTGLPQWFTAYDSSKIANLVYDVSTPLKMIATLLKALETNAAYVFITNDVLVNPWDTLPPYWKHEVDAIEFLNCVL